MMSDDASAKPGDADLVRGATNPLDGLTAQLGELEAFVARAEEDGEAIPEEAVEMMVRLREIVAALQGLTATMADDSAPPGTPS